jgi:hypothetical protein
MQLADLDEAKRSGLKKLDTLERVSCSASRSAQQYEAQIQALLQQVRDAQAATRAAEATLTKVITLRVCVSLGQAPALLSCPLLNMTQQCRPILTWPQHACVRPLCLQ